MKKMFNDHLTSIGFQISKIKITFHRYVLIKKILRSCECL